MIGKRPTSELDTRQRRPDFAARLRRVSVCRLTYLTNHISKLHRCMLPAIATQFSFGGVWIRYVLPDFRNALHCRPDFVVHLQLADNTTTRLFAFRGDAAVGGNDDRPRTDLRDLDDDRPRTDLGGLDLRSNASSNHRVELDSAQAASVTDEDYDAKGPQRTRYFIAVIVCFISICFWSVIS